MNGTGNYFTVIAIIVLAAKKQVTYDVITRDKEDDLHWINSLVSDMNSERAEVESFLPVLVSSFTESLSIF